jgi:hypothetical protein
MVGTIRKRFIEGEARTQVTLLPELNSIWVHLDLKVLIGVPWVAHVGWRDVHTALRYVDAGEAFGNWRQDAPES